MFLKTQCKIVVISLAVRWKKIGGSQSGRHDCVMSSSVRVKIFIQKVHFSLDLQTAMSSLIIVLAGVSDFFRLLKCLKIKCVLRVDITFS